MVKHPVQSEETSRADVARLERLVEQRELKLLRARAWRVGGHRKRRRVARCEVLLNEAKAALARAEGRAGEVA